MKHHLYTLLRYALLLLFLSSVSLAQTNPLELTLESYIVTTVTLDDGTTEERFSPADVAEPGQVIEYRLTLTNISDETLAAGLVAATGPIPQGTAFIAETATPSFDSARLEFSADGGETFSVPPLIILVTNEEGEEEEVTVQPEAYTTARWVILDPLEPEASFTFVYRVTVL